MLSFLRILQERAAHAIADTICPPPAPSGFTEVLPHVLAELAVLIPRWLAERAAESESVRGRLDLQRNSLTDMGMRLTVLELELEKLERFTGFRQPPPPTT